jgi:hypothetical protein
MGVVVVCFVLLGLGLAVGLRWGRVAVEPPRTSAAGSGRPSAGAVLRRYLWWLTVWSVAVLTSAVLAAGAGGRLVMRLLAQTSPEAQGRITDAGEVVGDITVGGSVGFLLFGALPAGLLAASLYLLVHRFLPSGWWRPVVLAGLLLIVFSVRLEPLRPDNVDFVILEPTWLALVTFCLLALLHAAVVVGAAGVYSRRLPDLGRQTLVWYTPLLAWVVLFPVGVIAGLVGALVVGISRLLPARLPTLPGGVTTGRAVLVAAAVIALPGFVAAVKDIIVR